MRDHKLDKKARLQPIPIESEWVKKVQRQMGRAANHSREQGVDLMESVRIFIAFRQKLFILMFQF